MKRDAAVILEDFIKRNCPDGLTSSDLSQIGDWDELVAIWNNTSPGSEPKRLVEARMAKVIKTAHSWDELVAIWNNTSPGSEPRRLVEARMAEILPGMLPQVGDWDELVAMQKNTSPGSEPRRLVEARMAKVIKTAHSWDELVAMQKNTSFGSKPEDLIEARMAELIEQIEASDIPDWFVRCAETNAFPQNVNDQAVKKAQEIV